MSIAYGARPDASERARRKQARGPAARQAAFLRVQSACTADAAGVALSVDHGGTIPFMPYVPAFCSLRSVAEPYRAPARRIPAEPTTPSIRLRQGGVAAASVASAAEPRYRGDPVMGVSYAYNLASTLYNDAEQRPCLVKQGLTRAGIEKV